MPTPLEYGFKDRFLVAEDADDPVRHILMQEFYGAVRVWRSTESDDRRGTDYWVDILNGREISIDAKIRDHDFGQDDVALELWSVIEKDKVGWTLDSTKRTEQVLWYWKDTQRFVILPFPQLCRAFREHLEPWSAKYKHAIQYTPDHGGYHSECLFVPRREIGAAIYRLSEGTLSANHQPQRPIIIGNSPNVDHRPRAARPPAARPPAARPHSFIVKWEEPF